MANTADKVRVLEKKVALLEALIKSASKAARAPEYVPAPKAAPKDSK